LEGGGGVVVAEGLEERLVTVELRDVPVNVAVNVIARRLGVDAVQVGSVWFIGQSRPEDRAVYVGQSSRLSAEQWQRVLAGVVSDRGRVECLPGGVVVVADRAEVLGRVASVVEQLEGTRVPMWVVQLVVVLWDESSWARVGLELGASGDVAYSLAASAPLSWSGSFEGSAVIRGVVEAAQSSRGGRVVADPLLVVLDGGKASLRSGRRIPVPQFTVSPEGTVSRTGWEFVDVGLTVEVSIRGVGESGLLEVEVIQGEVVGDVEGIPTTADHEVRVSAVMREAQAYLLASSVRESEDRNRTGFLMFERGRERSVLQVWGRAFRVAGSIPPTEGSSERSGDSQASEVAPGVEGECVGAVSRRAGSDALLSTRSVQAVSAVGCGVE
jgi:hypothetical protein